LLNSTVISFFIHSQREANPTTSPEGLEMVISGAETENPPSASRWTKKGRPVGSNHPQKEKKACETHQPEEVP
jgi:hypothetical protein